MSASAPTEPGSAAPLDEGRADLLDILAFQRWLLLGTVEGMSDDQARQRSTVSELTLGGLLKHLVTRVYFSLDDVPAEFPRRDTLVAKSSNEGVWTFDIRLQGEGETVFFDV